MKKPLFLLAISLFVYPLAMAGSIEADSTKIKQHYVNIEIGHSTSIFMDKRKKMEYGSNGQYYEPTFYKLSCRYTKHLTASFTYKNFVYQNRHFEMNNIETITYHAFDLSSGYLFISKNKHFRLEPFISLSARPSGTEAVHVGPGLGWHTSIVHIYGYKSLGFGMGLNAQLVLLKHLTLGFETQYNYFFEKTKLRGRLYYEDQNKNYKVSRQMITPAIKLGYLLNF